MNILNIRQHPLYFLYDSTTLMTGFLAKVVLANPGMIGKALELDISLSGNSPYFRT